MKCGRCGFFNMPGLEECAGCGAPVVSRLPHGEHYPLRARDRSWRDRWQAATAPPRRRWGELAAQLHQRFRVSSSGLTPRACLRALPGVVPGLFQFYSGDRWQGGALFGAAVLLSALMWATIRHPVSDALGWGLLSLSLCSFVNAWLSEESAANPSSSVWQVVAIPLYAVSLYSTAFFGAALWFGQHYVQYRVARTMSDTTAAGDVFLVQLRTAQQASPDAFLRPGALVAFERSDLTRQPAIGRVLSVGVSTGRAGKTAGSAARSATADSGTLLIDDLTYRQVSHQAPSAQRRYRRDAVLGPVLARVNPPRRREWFGRPVSPGPGNVEPASTGPATR